MCLSNSVSSCARKQEKREVVLHHAPGICLVYENIIFGSSFHVVQINVSVVFKNHEIIVIVLNTRVVVKFVFYCSPAFSNMDLFHTMNS